MKKQSSTIVLITASLLLTIACGKSPGKTGSSEGNGDNKLKNQNNVSQNKLFSYNEAVKEAKKLNKTVLVDFFADWCKYCKKMDEVTMSDPKVMEKLDQNFIRVRINTDKPDAQPLFYKNKKLTAKEFSAFMEVPGLPSLVFLDKDENVITMIPGYIEKDVFVPILNYITEECYKKNISFDTYMNEKNSCKGKS